MKVDYSFLSHSDSSECLLLVHGGPGMSSDYFAPSLETLAKNFNVATYDQGQNGALSLASLLEELDWVIRELEGRKSVTVLGHSFGGALVLEYIQRHPGHLQRLILCSWIYDNQFSAYREKHAATNDRPQPALLEFNDVQTAQNEDLAYMYDCLSWAPRYFSEKSIVAGIEALKKTKYNAALRDSLWTEFVSTLDLREILRTLNIPTLSLAGCEDGVVLHQYTEEGAQINRAFIRHHNINDAGHFPFIDNTTKFVDLVTEFISNK